MNILVLGAAGFIGTNLVIRLAKNTDNRIIVVDEKSDFFGDIRKFSFSNVIEIESPLNEKTNFDYLDGIDLVYHLVSTNTPTTSNKHISNDLQANISFSLKMLDACIKYNVPKVIFLSSGGTVYGKEFECPLSEDTPTSPITSYGVQKLTIEKLLYLYNYIYGLDYRIIRLSNPYGPYQRPNGILGAVTTFTYKALKKEEIQVFGDGSIVRDFIFIDDAITGIINITNGYSEYKIFNLGCGYGISINDVLKTIKLTLDMELNVKYCASREVDLPINYLNIERYEKEYGKLNPKSLADGIHITAEYMKREVLG